MMVPEIASPYFVRWSGETRMFLAPCQYAGGRIAASNPDQPGEGAPDFKNFHLGRSRQLVVEKRCQVCGNPVTAGEAWVFPRGAWIPAQDDGLQWLMYDYLMHANCAQLAKTYCPHLRQSGVSAVPGPVSYGIVAAGIDTTIYRRTLQCWEDAEPAMIGRLWLTLSVSDAVGLGIAVLPERMPRPERRHLMRGRFKHSPFILTHSTPA